MTHKTVVFLGSKNFGDKNDAGVLAGRVSEQLGSGYVVRHMYFEDLLFHISVPHRSIIHSLDGFDLKSADLVVALNWYPSGKRNLRDIAFTVALYLEENKVQYWNREMHQQRSTTKLSTLWLLSRNGLSIPNTYFSLNHEQLVRATTLVSPAIVKGIAASRGRSNYLVHSSDDLQQLLTEKSQTRFMVQEFVPNDYDVRLVCLGGEPRLALKRQRISDTTHLNNTSQGAHASLLKLDSLPDHVLHEARSICKLMGRELAGIDYVVANDGSGRYICLEVNAIPQLTSGSYVDQKMQAFSEAIASSFDKE